MKILLSTLALLASLLAGPAIAEVCAGSSQVPQVMFQNGTVAIGGTVTVPNTTGSSAIFRAYIAGELVGSKVVPSGGQFTFTVPNDPVLIGLTLKITGTPRPGSLNGPGLSQIKTWKIIG